MSTRRHPGEAVWKRAGAGFAAAAGLGLIPADAVPSPCLLCDDEGCREWPDVWPCDAGGHPTGGAWYHVSECEMEDRPR